MRALVAGACLLLTPLPLLAQPGSSALPGSSSVDEIVVHGSKPQKRVTDFVKTLLPVPRFEQVGRFVDPVCPAVVGLAPSENQAIVDRFRQVAKAAGAPVASGKCAANVLMIAAKSKRRFIDSIPRYAPSLVAGLSRERIAALAGAPGPVSAWQSTALLDQNGLAASMETWGNEVDRVSVLVSNDGSRLNRPSQVGVSVAVLVVEKNALARISTRQFADYAAMRTLAPVDPLSPRHALAGNPESKLAAPSILGLFDDGATPADSPPSVTWWDFAFLQALYDVGMTKSSVAQRSEIQARMIKILAKVPPDEM